MAPIFVVGPIAMAVTLLLFAPAAVAIPVGTLLVALAAVCAYKMAENYAWVELDGHVLRGQRFWTRAVIEQHIDDITRVVPMFSGMDGVEGMLTNVLIDALLGTSNRGFVIHFKTGPRMVLIRGDMSGVDQLILTLQDRLGERWQQVIAEPRAAPDRRAGVILGDSRWFFECLDGAGRDVGGIARKDRNTAIG